MMRKKHVLFGIITFFSYLTSGRYALCAAWNDPGVVLVQSISDHKYLDYGTGLEVDTTGMTSKTLQEHLGTGTDAGGGAASTTKWYQNKGAAGMSTTGKVIAAGTAVAGTVGVIQSASGSGEHGAGNMVSGITSGLAAGCSIGSFFPVWGTLIGCAVGLAVGGVVPGSQLFSETDCLHDPITKKYTCCNTVFNKGERQVEIGGYMFCETQVNGQQIFGVRQCLQGGSEKPASWWSGLWKDDAWAPECVTRYCKEAPPANTYIEFFADEKNMCINWRIPQDGQSSVPNDPYTGLIQRIQNEIKILQEQCGELL